jgi:hypothetical protein
MRLLLNWVKADDLKARRAFELIHRGQAGIGIDLRLSGLVVVTAFQRDLLSVKDFLTSLLDKFPVNRRFARIRLLVVTIPTIRAEACFERTRRKESRPSTTL